MGQCSSVITPSTTNTAKLENLLKSKTETAAELVKLITLHSGELIKFLGVKADSLKRSLAKISTRFKLEPSYAKVAEEYVIELSKQRLSKREETLFHIY